MKRATLMDDFLKRATLMDDFLAELKDNQSTF